MRSQDCFNHAKTILVGGVNSPVRSFSHVKETPRFIQSASGPYLTTVDGDRLIDYVLSWGPMILGHANPAVVEAIQVAAAKGTSFGAPSESETELAQLIRFFFPSMQKIRLVNSGTEACMSAIRLARGATARKRIIKFDGGYHGHVDSLLVAAGSGATTHSTPDSAGILPELAMWTTVLPFNDTHAWVNTVAECGHDIAGVIIEPIMGNMGLILPDPHFLQSIRHECSKVGALLIFDEVMTGFRVALGGAQSIYGITPDLTCLGKVVGGGLPCAAYGGKADIMDQLSPLGSVYQAGTLSGNPLAMAAGIATLIQLRDTDAFYDASLATQRLVTQLREKTDATQLTFHFMGTMWAWFLLAGPITQASQVLATNRDHFAQVYREVLANGVYLAPSPFESQFVSCLHGPDLIEHTVDVMVAALNRLN